MPHIRKPVYQGRMLQLDIDTVTLPNGETLDLEIVHHPGGAAVVVLNDRQQVCLLRQYRHAAGGWLWELPAGKLEPDEQPRVTAARELQEEAGVTARQWDELGTVMVTPGFCDEVIHLYLARELAHGTARPGIHEVLEVHWIDFDEAISWLHNGSLQDAKTMIGLNLATPLIRCQ